MPRDYMEVEGPEDFLRVCQKVDVVLRLDPLLIANYYGIFIFIDMRRLRAGQARALLSALKDKVVHVRRHATAASVSELLEGHQSST